jgi:uncharacterized UBP type Zn finger protein
MCRHLAPLLRPRATRVVAGSPGCQECLAAGGRWVHLRLCTTCGHVGCCDSSPGHHATAHFEVTGHPVIRSYEPGEDWAWCYPDEEAAEHVTTLEGESPPRHLEPPSHAPGPGA